MLLVNRISRMAFVNVTKGAEKASTMELCFGYCYLDREEQSPRLQCQNQILKLFYAVDTKKDNPIVLPLHYKSCSVVSNIVSRVAIIP